MVPYFPGFVLYCKQNLRGIHFSELLDICSNPSHDCYQEAWYEFERRYREIIFGRIRMYLKRWNAANNLDYVKDISSKITERLLANDCHALTTFAGRDNEANSSASWASFVNEQLKAI